MVNRAMGPISGTFPLLEAIRRLRHHPGQGLLFLLLLSPTRRKDEQFFEALAFLTD
jgi:hypothetical protein